MSLNLDGKYKNFYLSPKKIFVGRQKNFFGRQQKRRFCIFGWEKSDFCILVKKLTKSFCHKFKIVDNKQN